MKFLIATTNKHKTNEIKKILDYPDSTFISLSDNFDIPLADETGLTFLDNAIIKAKHYYGHLKIPAIADDSGLVIPALNNAPGIFSSRYAGVESDYKANNALLIKNMTGLREEERKAYFICVVVYYNGIDLISAEGRINGLIIDQPKGEQGFGYDPLFFYEPEKKTFAELSTAKKNKISHRFRALQQLKEKLDPFIMKST